MFTDIPLMPSVTNFLKRLRVPLVHSWMKQKKKLNRYKKTQAIDHNLRTILLQRKIFRLANMHNVAIIYYIINNSYRCLFRSFK